MNTDITLKYEFENQRRAALMTTIDSIRYENNILGTEGITFDVPPQYFVPRSLPKHPFYAGQYDPFDVEMYMYPRPPIDLGHSLISENTPHTINVLRMPIKFPDTEYKVPKELESYWPLIRRVAEYESGFNPRHRECFVHITVDRGLVRKGTTHRYPGFHGDGVQGAKFADKTPIEHSYILTSSPPTEFCLQPFFLKHLNDAVHNIFHEFEVQVKETNLYQTLPWHLYLLDPYMVHRTPFIEEDVDRIFIRITFAYTELQNPHNTNNPMFADRVYPDRHDIRKFLTLYPTNPPWAMYGFLSGPQDKRNM